LKITIGEEDAQMNTTAFDSVGETLFDMSASELASLAEADSDAYDGAFSSVVGKKYTCSIRAKYVSDGATLHSTILSMVPAPVTVAE
jgi:hypothetical protein